VYNARPGDGRGFAVDELRGEGEGAGAPERDRLLDLGVEGSDKRPGRAGGMRG
jgi:hypothetical protein